VWERALDGRTLQFRLIGINNQNFLMEDLETGSWWQQVSGAAVSGPLTGRRLTPVLHDEVTFGLWRAEHPATRVLGLDAEASQIKDTWEATTATARVVTPVRADDPLPPRTLVLGVVIDGEARAYPRETLRGSRVILDELHGVPIALLEAEDKHSVRVFSRRLDGATVDLLYKVDSTPARFIDEHRVGVRLHRTRRVGPAERPAARPGAAPLRLLVRLARVPPRHVHLRALAAPRRHALSRGRRRAAGSYPDSRSRKNVETMRSHSSGCSSAMPCPASAKT
jgi:Protein of unknown function (DUF3179)